MKSLGIECVLSQIQVYIMFVGMQFAVYIVFTLVVLPCYVACKRSWHSLRLLSLSMTCSKNTTDLDKVDID